MSRLWSVLLVCAMAIGAQDVSAKRIGGGLSVGKQSGSVTQRSAAPTSTPQQVPAQNAAARPAAPSPAAAAAAAPKRPWGAMLGGLAAGLGLAWLASSLGLGEGFAQFLMLALLAVVVIAVIRMVMRRGSAAAMTPPSPWCRAAWSASWHPKNSVSWKAWERSIRSPCGCSIDVTWRWIALPTCCHCASVWAAKAAAPVPPRVTSTPPKISMSFRERWIFGTFTLGTPP